MKKSLLALAALTAFAGAASAQSSVTLSGSLDAGIQRVGVVPASTGKAEYDNKIGGSQSGYNNVTLSGIEDLGNGSRAFFSLNHRFSIGNGTDNGFTNGGGVGTATTPGNAALIAEPFWRMAWVGLGGGFGDVRIGRIQMPLQDMNGGFDPFNTGTVGSTHTGGIAATVRANNTVYYRSPSLGGLSVHVAAAAADQQLGNTEIGSGGSGNPRGYFARAVFVPGERPVGLNVRYAAGPVNVGVAYDKNAADMKTIGVYGSFDFGAAKILAQFEKGDNYTSTAVVATAPNENIKTFSIGLTAPLGPVVLRTGFLKIKSDLAAHDATKFGFGGDYNLSKRTNLYTTVGKWSGKRFLTYPVAAPVTAVEYDKATRKVQFDFGVTHRF